MGAKPMNSSRDVDAAERFAPGDGISLPAGPRGKGVGRLEPPPDDLINLLFQVNQRLLHHAAKLIQTDALPQTQTSWTKSPLPGFQPCQKPQVILYHELVHGQLVAGVNPGLLGCHQKGLGRPSPGSPTGNT